jgi:integrase
MRRPSLTCQDDPSAFNYAIWKGYLMEDVKKKTTLTDAGIRKLSRQAVENKKMIRGKDSERRGLYLNAYPTGLIVWVAKVPNPIDSKKPAKWVKLGEYPQMGIAAAREAHGRARADVKAGKNPVDVRRQQAVEMASQAIKAAQDEERRKTETINGLIAEFKKLGCPRKSFLKNENQMRLVFAKLLDTPFQDLTYHDINRTALEYHAKSAANFSMGMLRPILKWGAGSYPWVPTELGMMVRNPHPPAKRGKLKITEEVAEKILPVLREEKGYGQCMWFMAHTGCRRSEADCATWDQIDMENSIWTIPGLTRKNTRNKADLPDLAITLPSQVMTLLTEIKSTSKSQYVFSLDWAKLQNWDRATKALQQKCGVEENAFHRHDFRHFFYTKMKKLAPGAVVSEAVGHAKSGMDGVYDHNNYVEERAVALAAWAQQLEIIETKGRKAAEEAQAMEVVEG